MALADILLVQEARLRLKDAGISDKMAVDMALESDINGDPAPAPYFTWIAVAEDLDLVQSKGK